MVSSIDKTTAVNDRAFNKLFLQSVYWVSATGLKLLNIWQWINHHTINLNIKILTRLRLKSGWYLVHIANSIWNVNNSLRKGHESPCQKKKKKSKRKKRLHTESYQKSHLFITMCATHSGSWDNRHLLVTAILLEPRAMPRNEKVSSKNPFCKMDEYRNTGICIV